MSNSNFSDYLNELADADGGVESVVSEGIENLKGKIKDVKVEAPLPVVSAGLLPGLLPEADQGADVRQQDADVRLP